MSKRINKKGFTLIEVVLVIAIGALIFLLAFIAFGNAQTNRKDSQRRTALDTMAAEIENYKSDRSGSLPATFDDLQPYISTLKTPEDGAYVKLTGTGTIAAAQKNTVLYQKWVSGSLAGCKDGTTITSSGYKIEMKLEKGVACRDSLPI